MKNCFQLRDEYAEHGIDFAYNNRERLSILKIKGAPLFVEGSSNNGPGAQLTGWYRVPGGLKNVQDVEGLSFRAKELYREAYKDNPQMLCYLSVHESSSFEKLLVFDEELCVQDDNHECIDGYLWATDGLVARLKSLVSAELSEDDLSAMENINFYPVYNLKDGSIELYATFWYETEDGTYAKHCQQQMPLTDKEANVLISSMDEYCRGSYGMNLLNFLNTARAQVNLPDLADPKAAYSLKFSLDARIATAEKRRADSKVQPERSGPALDR